MIILQEGYQISSMGFISSLKENWELMKLQRKMASVFPSFKEQNHWLARLQQVNRHVETAHNHSHILQFLIGMFELSPEVEGCVVEAGAYKGGSTAKISLVAAHLKRDLFVFDSFCGLPANKEKHEKSVLGHSIKNWFDEGNFAGTLDEVKANVKAYGDLSVCHFVQGWFKDTMPGFKNKIAMAYLDVDLAESTRTCLKYLYPQLSTGGAIYSQDGDFPLVMEVFNDKKFWVEEVGCNDIPPIENLGKKITIIRK